MAGNFTSVNENQLGFDTANPASQLPELVDAQSEVQTPIKYRQQVLERARMLGEQTLTGFVVDYSVFKKPEAVRLMTLKMMSHLRNTPLPDIAVSHALNLIGNWQPRCLQNEDAYSRALIRLMPNDFEKVDYSRYASSRRNIALVDDYLVIGVDDIKGEDIAIATLIEARLLPPKLATIEKVEETPSRISQFKNCSKEISSENGFFSPQEIMLIQQLVDAPNVSEAHRQLDITRPTANRMLSEIRSRIGINVKLGGPLEFIFLAQALNLINLDSIPDNMTDSLDKNDIAILKQEYNPSQENQDIIAISLSRWSRMYNKVGLKGNTRHHLALMAYKDGIIKIPDEIYDIIRRHQLKLGA